MIGHKCFASALLLLASALPCILAQSYIPGISVYHGDDVQNSYPVDVPKVSIPPYGGGKISFDPVPVNRRPSINDVLAGRLAGAQGWAGNGYGSYGYYPQGSGAYPSSGKALGQPDLYSQIDQVQRTPYGAGRQGSQGGVPASSPYRVTGQGQGQVCNPNDKHQSICQGFLLACQCTHCPKHGGCYTFCC